uniref:Rho GTPase-activating protein 7 n=1 Tax=Vitis vinifera TaxID=29760 RepID=A5BNY8_VITVI|nr:hypothetical protein VITISV_040461 [Vitis vinifera]
MMTLADQAPTRESAWQRVISIAESLRGACSLRWRRGFHECVDRRWTISVVPSKMKSEQYSQRSVQLLVAAHAVNAAQAIIITFMEEYENVLDGDNLHIYFISTDSWIENSGNEDSIDDENINMHEQNSPSFPRSLHSFQRRVLAKQRMDPFTVDEETEDDEETEGEAEDYIPVEGSTRVSQNGAVTSDQAISVNGGSDAVLALRVSDERFQEGGGEMRRVEGGEISAMGSSSSSNGGETQEGSDGWVQDQIDVVFLVGTYMASLASRNGFNNVEEVLGRKCTLRNVRTLYASRVVAVDEDLRKKIRSLEAKCASLEKKVASQPSAAAF